MTVSFDGSDLLGQSVAHDGVRWYLSWLTRGNVDGLVDEVPGRFTEGKNGDLLADFISQRIGQIGGFRLVEVEDRNEHCAIGVLETERGRRWRVMSAVDPVTGRLRHTGSTQMAGPGVTIRNATPSDGPRIAELIDGVPMVAGSRSLVIRYGEDYLQSTAMAADRIVMVAEVDGALVGVHGAALVDWEWRGVTSRHAYVRHLRVDPDVQGMGVFSALNGEVNIQVWMAADGLIGFTQLANDNMLDKLPSSSLRWGVSWERFHLSTRSLATGAPLPGPMDDPERAAGLVTAAQGTVMARVPVTPGTIVDRLARAPHLYGVDRFIGTDRALLGVGRLPVEVMRVGEPESLHREALAYDIGIAPDGGDADFSALLGAWCTVLADDGVDRLAIACGSASPIRAHLAELAIDHEQYLGGLEVAPPDGVTPSVAFDAALM